MTTNRTRISRTDADAIYEQVKADNARRADLEWSGYIKAKVPGRRGHAVFYPRGFDASSSSAIASWAGRKVGQLIAEGATIVSIGMVAEVRD